MSIKVRAALRLMSVIYVITAAMFAVYYITLNVPTITIVYCLSGAGVLFFIYQMFKVFVTLEEIEETRKNTQK